MAAWQGEPGLALGNAIGSVLADTAFIFGIGCIFLSPPAHAFVLKRQGVVHALSVFAIIALCYGSYFLLDASVNRYMEIFLIAALIAYLAISMKWGKEAPDLLSDDLEVEPNVLFSIFPAFVYPFCAIIIGLVVVFCSSKFVVGSAIQLATIWEVPEAVVSATIVAIGTSLPELAVAISAIKKKQPDLLVGNIIGADILNVLFVIGASSVVSGLAIVDADSSSPYVLLYLHLPAMFVMEVMFLFYVLMALKRGHFVKWNGYSLLALYVIFVASQWVFR
jgi:cation:H+ antiporter